MGLLPQAVHAMSRASCRTANSLWHGKVSPTLRHHLGQRQGGSVPPLPHVEAAKIPRFTLPCCSLSLVPRAGQFSWPPFLQQLSRLALDQAPRPCSPNRTTSPSPEPSRAGGPVACRRHLALASRWRGVYGPIPARGGAVVAGKGHLIFLYSACVDRSSES
jgi:hypothetical protein